METYTIKTGKPFNGVVPGCVVHALARPPPATAVLSCVL
jgi:hypothetical protein